MTFGLCDTPNNVIPLFDKKHHDSTESGIQQEECGMKKLSITFFLLLTLLAAACSPASADVITAMAIEVNPEHLEKTASYARILGYNPDSNTLTVELIAPEVFDEQEVKALRPGDSIFTGGHEVLIQTIEVNERGTYIINRGDDPEQSLYLTEDFRGYSMRTFLDDDYVWITLDVIKCPIQDSLLFLDYIDEESGNSVELPVVHTAQELTARLQEEDASEAFTVGLAANNVYVTFDGEGNLATIHRFYVPWQ